MPMSPAGALIQLNEGRLRGVLPELVSVLRTLMPCPVDMQLTPRARLARMFAVTLEADVFWPAVRLASRDTIARFVSFFHSTVCLVGRADRDLGPASVDALLAQSALRGALVGTVSFGPQFDDLSRALQAAGRITSVRDFSTALRMLAAGRVDFTLLNPLTVYGEGLETGVPPYATFRLRPLAGLPQFEGGVYVSRQSRPESEQLMLEQAFRRLRDDGHVLRVLRKYYPPEVLRLEFEPPPARGR